MTENLLHTHDRLICYYLHHYNVIGLASDLLHEAWHLYHLYHLIG